MTTPRTLDDFDHGFAAVTATQFAAAAIVARFGPDGLIPMHFDIGGEVDRWGERWQVMGLLVGLAVVCAISGLLFHAQRRAPDLSAGTRSVLNVGSLILIGVFLAVTALLTALGLGAMNPGQAQLSNLHGALALVWVILAVIGAVVGKAGPNRAVGVRVYWTRTSRLAWDKANRLIGRIYFFGGLVGVLVTSFLSPYANVALLLAFALGGALAATWEAWRVWRIDPERS